MKRFPQVFALAFVLSIMLSACGGGGSSSLTAESPVDFTMSVLEFDKVEKGEKDKYEGKVVELSGLVNTTKQSHPNDAADGEWMIKLKGEADGGFPPETSCFFSADQAAQKGKMATVKGTIKFYEFSEGAFLTGCFLTAK